MNVFPRLFISALLVFFLTVSAHAKEPPGKSVVMVKINEQIFVDDSAIYDYYGNLKDVLNIWASVSQADITIIGILLENNFRVVGSGIPNTTKGNVAKDEILKAVEGDDFASMHLGNYLNADIVVVGKAISKGVSMMKGSQQKSARANVNVRVIDAKTGEILAVESQDATAAAIDELSAGVEAIKIASRSIAQNIVKKLSEKK